jgi:transposase
MMATQLPLVQIAQGFTVTSATLINWKHRWLKRRHFGLADAPRSGRPSKADARYVKELLRVVRRDPRELRYAFTRWTAPRLAQYLGEETGVWLTPQWITELLRTHGIVWRKTKRTIRNLQKRAATERARKALQRLKKGL